MFGTIVIQINSNISSLSLTIVSAFEFEEKVLYILS